MSDNNSSLWKFCQLIVAKHFIATICGYGISLVKIKVLIVPHKKLEQIR